MATALWTTGTAADAAANSGTLDVAGAGVTNLPTPRTWAALKANVVSFSNRSDITPELMATFRDLAEQRIYHGAPDGACDPLRLEAMLEQRTLYRPFLPADCLEIVRVSLADGTLLRAAPAREITPALDVVTVTPSVYAVSGGRLLVPGVFPAGRIVLSFYRRFATPNADADSNWLMDRAPALYLWAMLAEVCVWLRDEPGMRSHLAQFASAHRALTRSSDPWRGSGPLTIRRG